jgi:hypothetical protein
MNQVHSDSSWTDSFLHGAARAFFVTAYADFVEDFERENDDHEYIEACSGQDWMDCSPETTPAYAYALADELLAGIKASNPDLEHGVHSAQELAKEADGEKPDPDLFGHYFAMQSMGHGVSWFDSHNHFPLTLPRIECSQDSFNHEAYRSE